jgi:host factor-I protein
MAFRGPNHDASTRPLKNPPPPDDTHQEAAYLKMLGEQQHPVVVKLLDGSVFHGWIEYYDRRMVRLTREGGPNLFIFKHEIAYIAEDAGRQPRSGNLPGVKNGNSTSAAK